MTKRVYNFYPGPATLSLPVLKKAQSELLDYKGTGMSVMEISHRSKEYSEIHTMASALVQKLMNIPDEYKQYGKEERNPKNKNYLDKNKNRKKKQARI